MTYIVVINYQLLLYYIGVQLLVCISLSGICIWSAFIGHFIIYKIYLYSCTELSMDWIMLNSCSKMQLQVCICEYTLCISARLHEMLNCLASDTAVKAVNRLISCLAGASNSALMASHIVSKYIFFLLLRCVWLHSVYHCIYRQLIYEFIVPCLIVLIAHYYIGIVL